MREIDFYQEIKNWRDHCKNPEVQLSSSSESVINCEPYRRIVSLGLEALPLIRKTYDIDSPNDFELSIVQGHLISVVGEIMEGKFKVPEEIRGKISAMEEYTKKWLDENIHKYLL